MSGKILRFLLVGLVNTFVGLGVTFLLYHGLQTGYWVATALGNASGVAVSYVLNRRYTFAVKAGGPRYWLKFLTVVVVSYFIAYRLSLTLILVLFPTFGGTGAILVGMVLYTVLNFLGQNYWVFQKSIG